MLFFRLLLAFIVAASVNKQQRRKVETRPYHSHSQYRYTPYLVVAVLLIWIRIILYGF